MAMFILIFSNCSMNTPARERSSPPCKEPTSDPASALAALVGSPLSSHAFLNFLCSSEASFSCTATMVFETSLSWSTESR